MAIYGCMSRLSFTSWLLREAAKYGFADEDSQILGGTEVMKGDNLFSRIDTTLVITELTGMPPLGDMDCHQLWDDCVQWGRGPGSIKASITPAGSIKVLTRRLTTSLEGAPTWVLKHVYPLRDYRDQLHESDIAERVYGEVRKISSLPIDSPVHEYGDLERLAQRLWHTTKKRHPGYIMFPTSLWKQRENYFKLVYEFRGQGAGTPHKGSTGRAEQFDIDLVYEPRSGFIRCIGYDIDSSMRQHSWEIQTPEWDERFSPRQDEQDIVECIVKMFLQY